MLACCLALAGSSPAAASDVVLNMTGRITRDCLVNSGLGLRFRYDHAPNQLCHLAEATASGPLLNLSWPTPLCKESPDDKRCLEWAAGGCCVWCGARSGQHTQEETRGTSLAPGSYTEVVSATPFVAGGASVMGFFEFNWTQSGNINDTRVCAGDSAGFALNPGETWSVRLIVPDLGQTTRLERIDGDGQQTLARDILSRPLRVKVSGADNNGQVELKEGVAIAWTVTDPDGVTFSQFQSQTDPDGISAVTVPLGSKIGQYTITAVCSECIANREVTFTATVLTVDEATNLVLVACDGNGIVGSKTTNPMKVRAVNIVTGAGRGGVAVSFTPTGSVSVNPTGQTTSVGTGIAFTAVIFSKVAGSGSVTASCGQCKGNQSVTCNLTSIPDKPRPPDQSPPVGGDGDPTKPGSGDFRMGIQFQAQQPRIGVIKTIANPSMDRIGVIAGDSIRFLVLTTPDQLLQDSDVSWQGEGAGSGRSLLVQFPTPGLRQETAVVTGKQVQALIDVAPMPTFTQEAFCFSQPVLCGLAAIERNPAINWSQSVAASIGRGARNGPQDAVRHAYWSALMTVRVAGFIAEGVGTGHEGGTIAKGEPHNESVMDLENNAIGRQIGQALLNSGLTSSQIPDSELQNRVLNAFNAGQLTIMDEGGRNATSLTGLLRQSR